LGCRSPSRSRKRSTVRRACRAGAGRRRAFRVAVRTRWRAPDSLGQALAAFRRALQAHRRLARLAPRFFDSVVVERERREQEARRRWRAIWEPALNKVYGSEPNPVPKPPELPPLPPPRVQQEVDRELAAWECWLNTGRLALQCYARRHPHALASLTRVARLLEFASRFGRLASGFDPNRPAPEPPNYDAAWADLERACGHRCDSASSGLAAPTCPAQASERRGKPGEGGPGSPPAPAAPASNPPPHSRPVQSVPSAPNSVPPPSPEPCSPPVPVLPHSQPRRDAWSSWARHLRRKR
jgi:hypothetical protein